MSIMLPEASCYDDDALRRETYVLSKFKENCCFFVRGISNNLFKNQEYENIVGL